MSWDWEKLKEQQQQHGGGGGGGGIPPQMDDLFKKFKQTNFPGGPVAIIVVILIFLGVYFGSTMIFTIKTGKLGVIQRFGKFNRNAPPGLGFKLPDGIEKLTKVDMEEIYTEEFGFASPPATRGKSYLEADSQNVSLMLTGDLNVAIVPWVVLYKIKDPYNYLFKVQNVKGLLRDLSESSMRLVVGDRSIDEVITKRNEIAEEAKKILQKELDVAETGIHIQTIELKKTNVPGPVQSSFNEVNQAIQEKEKMIYQAEEEYNKAIPAARGEADRTIKAAEGYSSDKVNRAQGDASRFLAVYHEYEKAKDVTKRRLYLEMLKDLFPKVGHKYVIDSEQKNLLPLLNLGKNNGDQK